MHFATFLKAEAERFMREVIQKPYLAIHLRRGDFLYAHRETVATIPQVMQQVRVVLKERGLDTLFIATDARPDDKEYREMDTAGIRVFR